MSHKSITAVVSIDKTNLKDDVEAMLKLNGYTLQDLKMVEKQNEYRRLYNLRPEVVAKRKVYSQKRYLKMKMLKALLQDRVTL
jgi:hypothetical protein